MASAAPPITTAIQDLIEQTLQDWASPDARFLGGAEPHAMTDPIEVYAIDIARLYDGTDLVPVRPHGWRTIVLGSGGQMQVADVRGTAESFSFARLASADWVEDLMRAAHAAEQADLDDASSPARIVESGALRVSALWVERAHGDQYFPFYGLESAPLEAAAFREVLLTRLTQLEHAYRDAAGAAEGDTAA